MVKGSEKTVLRTFRIFHSSASVYSNSIHEHNVQIMLGILQFFSLIFEKSFPIHSQFVCFQGNFHQRCQKQTCRNLYTLSNFTFLYQFMCHLFDSHAHTGFARSFSLLLNWQEEKKKAATSHIQQHRSNLIEAIYVKQLKKFP